MTTHASQNDHIEDIVARQEASTEARGKLKALTDAWKSLPTEEKAAEAVKVIKAYQGEVNALTRRARAVESSFSTVFNDFQSAVDPVPALQAGADAAATAADLQRSLAAARAEVSATDQELQGLANQEVTIRRLTDRVEQLSSQLDARVAEAVSQREAELTASHQQELEAARTAEGNALRRAALAQDAADAAVKRAQQAASAQASAAASSATTSSATAAQVSQLSEELNALTQQMHALQAQNSTLNTRLREMTSAPAPPSDGGEGGVSSASQAEVQRLTSELEAAKQRASAASAQMLAVQTQVQVLQDAAANAAAAADARVAQLQSDLASRPSRDAFRELQSELHMLQRVYFAPATDGSKTATASGEGDSTPPSTELEGGSGLSEAVLRRARQLEGTVVSLRQELDAAHNAHAAVSEELQGVRDELVAATAARKQLEVELALATGDAPPGSTGHQGQHTPPRTNAMTGEGDRASSGPLTAEQQLLAVMASPGVQANVQAGTSREAPLEGGQQRQSEGPPASDAAGEAETQSEPVSGGGADLTALFRSQRDRFKEAAEGAEAKVAALQAQYEGAQVALGQVEADNVKLYEQIRYLEAMLAGPGRGAGLAHGQGASAAYIASDAGRTASIGSALAGGPGATAGGAHMAHLAQRAGSEQGRVWDALSLLLLRLYWTAMELVGRANSMRHGRMVRVPGALSSSGGVLPGQGGPAGAAAAALPSDESAIGSAEGGRADAAAPSSRYRAKYEESVDPFAAFKEEQRTAAAASLSFFDRAALSLAGSLVSTGGSRTMAVVYLLAVHVAALLWFWCPASGTQEGAA